ncbi:MAG: thioredoxin family protein [Phycisphaerae bacterium]|nr:thioredoxin family protein [Phycisphaerae bacterium]
MNQKATGAVLRVAGWAVLLSLLPAGLSAAESEPYVFNPEGAKKPILTVKAYSDQIGIVPGEPFNILVSIKSEDGWHVYWTNPNATGRPTEITWKLPPGFEYGRSRFPAPIAKYDKTLNETAFLLPEQALIVTPIRAPANLKVGDQITLEADVSWLACKATCIPGHTSPPISIKLPVLSAASKPKRVNQSLFEDAESGFPTSDGKTPNIKLSTSLEPEVARPGGKLTAVVDVEIAPKMHMQSSKPLQDFLIPAAIFVDATEGLDFGSVEYPKPQQREDKFFGTVSEYGGKVTFRIPADVDRDAGQSPRWIRAIFQYQICDDGGTCFPPERVSFEIPVRMEGGPVPAKSSEWMTSHATPDAHVGITPAAAPTLLKPDGSSVDSTVAAQSNLFDRFSNWLLEFGYIGALAAAFLGGLILNLMPCVLPVLSLKILSFVRQAHEDRAKVFLLGLTYCAGILTFFGVLAALFAWTGTGWGQLFQRPVFVIIVAGVVTAFAMSLFGVFTVFTPRVVSDLDEKVQGEGYTSAYATGVLATLLGTACTAPFLTAAIGAATKITISHSAAHAAMIFLVAGFGMAAPFLLLAANPAWMRFIPKPGNWMHIFEAIMGFLLLITVIWVLNPLRGQIGDFGVLISLFFLLMVSMAVWVKGKIDYNASFSKKAALYSLAVILIATGWLVPFRLLSTIDQLVAQRIERNELMADGRQFQAIRKSGNLGPLNATAREETELLVQRLESLIAEQSRGEGETGALCDILTPLETLIAKLNASNSTSFNPPKELDWSNGIPWYHYRRDEVHNDVSAGYTVFVDYTADWCANCKINLGTSITHAEVVQLMKEYNVVPYEADFTLPVPEIKQDLERFGKAGVPMYLVYSPGDPDNPQVLPELLTPGIVLDALRTAGPSRIRPGVNAVATKPE